MVTRGVGDVVVVCITVSDILCCRIVVRQEQGNIFLNLFFNLAGNRGGYNNQYGGSYRSDHYNNRGGFQKPRR